MVMIEIRQVGDAITNYCANTNTAVVGPDRK